MKFFSAHLGSRALSLLFAFSILAPWGGVLLMPEEAFAQTGPTTNRGALQNAAARQGGEVSWTQAAASGAIGIGACFAGAGITLGSGLALATGSVLAAFGIEELFKPTPPPNQPPGPGDDPTGAYLPDPVDPVPVTDEKTHKLLKQLIDTERLNLIQISTVNAKEQFWDCVGWASFKLVSSAVTADIVNWINNDFEGKPAFIQDFRGFFLGVADRAIGSIIESDSALAFLCSPFQLNIRIALAMRFGQRAPTCTLTEVIANIENFITSFTDGGWASWLQFTVMPMNNPYGGYLTAEARVVFTYQTAVGTQEFELFSSKGGFLSKKELVGCEVGQSPGQGSCREVIVTPGEIVATRLEETLGIPHLQLALADEFSEITSALAVKLLTKVMSSLTGLSQAKAYSDDYYRGSTFTGDLVGGGEEDAPNNGVIGDIDAAIQNEEEYKNLNELAIEAIIDAQEDLGDAASCWHSKEAGTSTPPLASLDDRRQAGVQGRTIDFAIAALERKKDPFRLSIENSDRNIVALEALIVRAEQAQTEAQLTEILYDLSTLRVAGDMALPNDFASFETRAIALQSELTTYSTTARTEQTRCQYFPLDPPSQQPFFIPTDETI